MQTSQLDAPSLQQWMIERVAREVGVHTDAIGAKEGLMNLGMDSLALIGLAGELAELTNCDLPAEILWELNSIEAVAQHIASLVRELAGEGEPTKPTIFEAEATRNSYLASAQAWSPIRPLQANGSRPPLFIVHGLAGGTYDCHPLVSHLGDNQPVFGLDQSPEPPSSIEAMAKSLVDGLRTVQRKGPYHLLGFCFGGIVAYEVARQLVEQGDTVSVVGMFDPPAPGRFPRLRGKEAVVWPGVAGSALAGAHGYLMWEAARTPRKTWGRVRGKIALWRHRLRRRMRMTDHRISDYWVSEFQPRCQAIVRHNVTALLSYTPKPYPARLVLFLSREQRFMHGATAWRWRKLAAAGATLIRVPGTHDTMIEQRYAGAIAKQLEDQLRAAQGRL